MSNRIGSVSVPSAIMGPIQVQNPTDEQVLNEVKGNIEKLVSDAMANETEGSPAGGFHGPSLHVGKFGGFDFGGTLHLDEGKVYFTGLLGGDAEISLDLGPKEQFPVYIGKLPHGAVG